MTTQLPVAAAVTVGSGLVLSGGTLAVAYGTTPDTVAPGNDTRITGALQVNAIPAAPSQLLGGSSAAGSATAVTVGSGLTLFGATLSASTATTSQFGLVKPDGTSITITAGVISAVGVGSITPLSNATPVVNGIAAPGGSVSASRADHVHPIDTSRAPLANPIFTGTVTIPSGASIAGFAPLKNPAFTGSITLPSWTTTTRPASPVAGMEGFATDTARRETFTGTAWVQYVRATDVVSATAAGIAPASGGGNTNFLRADGSWAAPPGAAGGNPVPRVITSSANTILLTSDSIVGFNRRTSPAATLVTLPASPTAGMSLTIVDMAGNAAAYPISIEPSSGTILGATSYPLSQNYGSISVMCMQVSPTIWSIV